MDHPHFTQIYAPVCVRLNRSLFLMFIGLAPDLQNILRHVTNAANHYTTPPTTCPVLSYESRTRPSQVRYWSLTSLNIAQMISDKERPRPLSRKPRPRRPMHRVQPNSRRKCVISRDVSQNMPNFTENSRAPQTLFRGAMLLQTKKSVE